MMDDFHENPMKFLAGVCATAMTVFYGLFISNMIWGYIPADHFIWPFITNAMYYGPLTLSALCSLSLVWNKSLIYKIAFLAVWVAIIIFSFFPSIFAEYIV
jgi:hypothetical protein